MFPAHAISVPRALGRKLIVLANTLLKEDREWTPAFSPSAET